MTDTETYRVTTPVDALLEVIREQAAEIDRLRDSVPRLTADIRHLRNELERVSEERERDRARAAAEMDRLQMREALRDVAATPPPKFDRPTAQPATEAANAARLMLDAMFSHPRIEQYTAAQADTLSAIARAMNAYADRMAAEVATLRAENDRLRAQVASSPGATP